jgi:hypothetical protein
MYKEQSTANGKETTAGEEGKEDKNNETSKKKDDGKVEEGEVVE